MDSENPFQSPSLEASAYTPHQPGGSLLRSLIAVILGGIVVDYFGTQLVNYVVAYGVIGSTDPYTVAMAFQSTPIRVLMLTSGVACSFFGGMMAAWMDRRHHVLHALLSV